ncbi:hypothetical protein C8F04DRAFT_1200671 [Mycena alexandri]|uniref:Uncharacterized protein n=1 Tax=Mycena alexandri TaxID=1745969 RepID=A0AAD6RZV6_9AGAR|nr:hypothetical protein C8F04DRAFT_1200671 [Mycena alexandri]
MISRKDLEKGKAGSHESEQMYGCVRYSLTHFQKSHSGSHFTEVSKARTALKDGCGAAVQFAALRRTACKLNILSQIGGTQIQGWVSLGSFKHNLLHKKGTEILIMTRRGGALRRRKPNILIPSFVYGIRIRVIDAALPWTSPRYAAWLQNTTSSFKSLLASIRFHLTLFEHCSTRSPTVLALAALVVPAEFKGEQCRAARVRVVQARQAIRGSVHPCPESPQRLEGEQNSDPALRNFNMRLREYNWGVPPFASDSSSVSRSHSARSSTLNTSQKSTGEPKIFCVVIQINSRQSTVRLGDLRGRQKPLCTMRVLDLAMVRPFSTTTEDFHCPIREKLSLRSCHFIALEHVVRGAFLYPIFGGKDGMHYIVDCVDEDILVIPLVFFFTLKDYTQEAWLQTGMDERLGAGSNPPLPGVRSTSKPFDGAMLSDAVACELGFFRHQRSWGNIFRAQDSGDREGAWGMTRMPQ